MDNVKEKVECCATCYYGTRLPDATVKDKGPGGGPAGIFKHMVQPSGQRICRRYPPHAINITVLGTVCAYTFDNEWCGEYRADK